MWIRDRAPLFGSVRAEAVAVTEVTRIFHASNVIGWRELGVDAWAFQTAVDEIVCPICEPLHGKEFHLEDTENSPPRHPRCRCFSKPIVRLPKIGKNFLPTRGEIVPDFPLIQPEDGVAVRGEPRIFSAVL